MSNDQLLQHIEENIQLLFESKSISLPLDKLVRDRNGYTLDLEASNIHSDHFQKYTFIHIRESNKDEAKAVYSRSKNILEYILNNHAKISKSIISEFLKVQKNKIDKIQLRKHVKLREIEVSSTSILAGYDIVDLKSSDNLAEPTVEFNTNTDKIKNIEF